MRCSRMKKYLGERNEKAAVKECRILDAFMLTLSADVLVVLVLTPSFNILVAQHHKITSCFNSSTPRNSSAKMKICNCTQYISSSIISPTDHFTLFSYKSMMQAHCLLQDESVEANRRLGALRMLPELL